MNQIYDLISPPDSAAPLNTGPVSTGPAETGPVGACGSVIRDHSAAELATLADAGLAAKAAAKEAGRVSEMLAAGMLSLTNLTPDALPELLQRP